MYSLFVLILISFPFQYVFVTKNALMKISFYMDLYMLDNHFKRMDPAINIIILTHTSH